jgi:uncharacterized membrane protein
MQLIILGYVPGTDIQITFGFIAQVSAVVALFYLVHLFVKEEKALRAQQTESIESVAI